MNHDDDVSNVLTKDGVELIDLKSFENKACVSLEDIKTTFGNRAWAVESYTMRGLVGTY